MKEKYNRHFSRNPSLSPQSMTLHYTLIFQACLRPGRHLRHALLADLASNMTCPIFGMVSVCAGIDDGIRQMSIGRAQMIYMHWVSTVLGA
jgi:hypothetical protein